MGRQKKQQTRLCTVNSLNLQGYVDVLMRDKDTADPSLSEVVLPVIEVNTTNSKPAVEDF